MLRPTRLSQFGRSPALAARRLGDSRLALGLAGLGGAWGPVDSGESLETVLEALVSGVNAFDTAPTYGNSEVLLGRALAQWRGPRPVVSTKIGRAVGSHAMEEQFDHTSEGLRNSLLRSLDRLGLPQVDLLFLHEPEYAPPPERPRVLEVMCRLREEGLTRRLGLAGGYKEGWEGFWESGAIDVVLLFRRLDPCIFVGLEVDLPVIRKAGVLTYGASPLHMGLLGSRYEEIVRARAGWVSGPQIDRAIQLKALADAHGLPLATLAHRFMFGVGEIDRVVIGARNRSELRAALADFAAGPLPPALFDEICAGAPVSSKPA